jgi:hypothetical protein
VLLHQYLTQGGFDCGGVVTVVAIVDRAGEWGVIEKDHFGLIAASSAEVVLTCESLGN